MATVHRTDFVSITKTLCACTVGRSVVSCASRLSDLLDSRSPCTLPGLCPSSTTLGGRTRQAKAFSCLFLAMTQLLVPTRVLRILCPSYPTSDVGHSTAMTPNRGPILAGMPIIKFRRQLGDI